MEGWGRGDMIRPFRRIMIIILGRPTFFVRRYARFAFTARGDEAKFSAHLNVQYRWKKFRDVNRGSKGTRAKMIPKYAGEFVLFIRAGDAGIKILRCRGFARRVESIFGY